MKTLLITILAVLSFASINVFAAPNAMGTNMMQKDNMVVLICQDGDPLICHRQDANTMMRNNPTAAGMEYDDFEDSQKGDHDANEDDFEHEHDRYDDDY